MKKPVLLNEIDTNQAKDIQDFYVSVFSHAEGTDEGQLIGALVADLLKENYGDDVYGYAAGDNNQLVGCILFSRLRFEVEKNAFILSPVAVRSDRQGQGIGQALITFGIEALKSKGVELIMTYGDPNFYGKVGFAPVSFDAIKPPFNLTQPEGWIGQSLVDTDIESISGRVTCVKALMNEVYW